MVVVVDFSFFFPLCGMMLELRNFGWSGLAHRWQQEVISADLCLN